VSNDNSIKYLTLSLKGECFPPQNVKERSLFAPFQTPRYNHPHKFKEVSNNYS